jgi:hypothetical protein
MALGDFMTLPDAHAESCGQRLRTLQTGSLPQKNTVILEFHNHPG